ncbi:MAG: hypothetical protein KDD69_14045 [Bdellovibrionales bacterium]|nr:hypothetical protein [Bdellovibrionales bacterium]
MRTFRRLLFCLALLVSAGCDRVYEVGRLLPVDSLPSSQQSMEQCILAVLTDTDGISEIRLTRTAERTTWSLAAGRSVEPGMSHFSYRTAIGVGGLYLQLPNGSGTVAVKAYFLRLNTPFTSDEEVIAQTLSERIASDVVSRCFSNERPSDRAPK